MFVEVDDGLGNLPACGQEMRNDNDLRPHQLGRFRAGAALETPRQRLLAGLAGGILAVTAIVVVAGIARAFDVSLKLVASRGHSAQTIPFGGFATMTLAGAVVGILLAAGPGRWAQDPATRFISIAVVGPVLSLVPDVVLLAARLRAGHSEAQREPERSVNAPCHLPSTAWGYPGQVTRSTTSVGAVAVRSPSRRVSHSRLAWWRSSLWLKRLR